MKRLYSKCIRLSGPLNSDHGWQTSVYKTSVATNRRDLVAGIFTDYAIMYMTCS